MSTKPNKPTKKRKNRLNIDRILAIVALTTIAIAWFAGGALAQSNLTPALRQAFPEADIFYRLGYPDIAKVSALVGRGIGDLLDMVVNHLKKELPVVDSKKEETTINISVVGKPNVGKSSFVNAILGEKKMIVTETPGTTRDAIDSYFRYKTRKICLIDTAGLRKKARVKEDLEFYTTLRTIRAIEGCHVALVLIDAEQGLSVQDLKVVEDAIGARRAVVMAVNKWDLIEKDTHTADRFTSDIKEAARTVAYIPQIYISCLG